MIITDILGKGRVRQHNDRGPIAEARLSANISYLSCKEALLRDLPHGISASPSEGRKSLRQIWILMASQTLPSMAHSWSLHEDHVSYLIERKRSGDDGRTTSENVDYPYRAVVGTAALVSTILRPISGNAFMTTIEGLVDDEKGTFESNTNACVESFARNLENVANLRVFHTESVMRGSPERLQGRYYVDRIFAQQRAFVKAVCGLIASNTGVLWEALQLTFSIHTSNTHDDKDNETHSTAMVGDDGPMPLPPLPPLPPPPPPPPHAHAVPLGPVVVGCRVQSQEKKRHCASEDDLVHMPSKHQKPSAHVA